MSFIRLRKIISSFSSMVVSPFGTIIKLSLFINPTLIPSGKFASASVLLTNLDDFKALRELSLLDYYL